MKNTDLRDRILSLFERAYPRSFKTKELAKQLHLPKSGERYQALKAALRALQEAGIVDRIEGRKWGLALREQGTGDDLHVPSGDLAAMPANEDRAGTIDRPTGRKGLRGGPAGGKRTRHTETVGRPQGIVVGAVKVFHEHAVIEPDGKALRGDVFVMQKDLNGARDGDKVVAELLPMSRPEAPPHARVLEVLGRRGVPDVELVALARQYGLSIEFPEAVEAEAHAVPARISSKELEGRLDLRDSVCFTVDPQDAKDFDDAVSIDVDAEGNYLVGVHIADVSHYVRAGSKLDREAYSRGTSVYMVDGVVPMLPERLSNHLCSLKEGKDRLTFSVLMTVSPRGAVRAYSFHKSVIRSRKRFSYQEVEEIIKSGEGRYADEIGTMNTIAQVLTRKRLREGSIDFAVPEVKFVLDARGFPLDIVAQERLRSMRLIEEFMLLANRTVAADIWKRNTARTVVPFLYRVHDVPDPEKVSELLDFIRHLGITVRLEPSSSKSFQKMIEQLADKPESAVVQDITIRTMAKAVYSEKNIGHFGLGFKEYTHFTSPIRRYPDLIVHRLLAHYLKISGEALPAGYSRSLPDIAQRSSERERLAVEAERESVKIKEVEYMQRHLGDEFQAVISGVTAYGLYVEIIPFLVEGLVHVKNMDDDYYDFDSRSKSLIGRRRRKRYTLGGRVTVQVARVDLAARKLDFVIVTE